LQAARSGSVRADAAGAKHGERHAATTACKNAVWSKSLSPRSAAAELAKACSPWRFLIVNCSPHLHAVL